MTLDEILYQRLGSWRPPEGRHELTLAEETPGWAVTIAADRNDEVGSLVWELNLRRVAGAPQRQVPLKDWAGNIAARVTGLLEPLKVIEVDPIQDQALLRSSAASQRGDKLYYYEVRLRGTSEAQVCRYQAKSNNNGPRDQVPFALTHETLIKFIGDLTADK
jgi:hypothetical protein